VSVHCEDRPSVDDLLDDVAREMIGFLLWVLIGVKAVVAICFFRESMEPSSAFLRPPDVAEIIVAYVKSMRAAAFSSVTAVVYAAI
jgi:hypothetical protein